MEFTIIGGFVTFPYQTSCDTRWKNHEPKDMQKQVKVKASYPHP